MSASDSSDLLFVIGTNHHTAPIEVREQLALTDSKLGAFQRAAAEIAGLREIAVLNTCNRVELYGVAESADVIERLQGEFCAVSGLSVEQFASIRQLEAGQNAITHLLGVAAGLNSQMLGENEIFGQVKDAYEAAQSRRTVGPVLNRVFQKAFQGAKYVRTHTALNAGQVSIANVAVDLALNIFGNLSHTRVLLLGAGDIGEKTARAFQSRGAQALTVASRTLHRAMELATEYGATALPFEQVPGRLHEFDIAVCSTAAPTAVVTQAAVIQALKRRPAQPLFFVDLALPRDVEPEITQLENAFLYNLDDLARIAENNRAAREAEVSKARAIVTERSHAIWQQVSRHVGGTERAEARAEPSVSHLSGPVVARRVIPKET